MILYEYPFNERQRTYLRLEQLFRRLSELLEGESALDHHFALTTLFELLDVAARADLKADILKDLERQKNLLDSYRGNPSIAEEMLDHIIAQLDTAFAALNAQTGKTGQSLTENDWLMAVRSRMGIPGGTCGFDLPAYHTWKHLPCERRRVDLQRWSACFQPLSNALLLLLGLLRDTGVPQKVAASKGHFQQYLPAGRSFQLLRLRIDPELNLVPEISGNRLMVSVRLMRPDEAGKLQPTHEEAAFELTLCA